MAFRLLCLIVSVYWISAPFVACACGTVSMWANGQQQYTHHGIFSACDCEGKCNAHSDCGAWTWSDTSKHCYRWSGSVTTSNRATKASEYAGPAPTPTKYPTKVPTKSPTKSPTKFPTKLPTKFPTPQPTTRCPTHTVSPTAAPVPLKSFGPNSDLADNLTLSSKMDLGYVPRFSAYSISFQVYLNSGQYQCMINYGNSLGTDASVYSMGEREIHFAVLTENEHGERVWKYLYATNLDLHAWHRFQLNVTAYREMRLSINETLRGTNTLPAIIEVGYGGEALMPRGANHVVAHSCATPRSLIKDVRIFSIWESMAPTTSSPITHSPTTASPTSPSESFYVNGRYFQILRTTPMNCNDARDYCNARNLTVATLRTRDELSAVRNRMGQDELFWTGYYAVSTNYVKPEWGMLDGSLPLIFNFNQEPNSSYAKGKCVALSQRNGLYAMLSNSSTQNFVCSNRSTVLPYREHFSSSGRKFRFSLNYRFWPSARKSCQDVGMELASIHTDADRAAVANLTANANGAGIFWIGGNDMAADGEFEWSDGSPWDMARWIPDQKHSSDNAVSYLNKSGHWGYIHESAYHAKRQYICATPPNPPRNFTQSTVVGERIFTLVFNQTANVTAAKSACRSLGLELASIHNGSEVSMVRSKLLGNLHHTVIWIGAERKTTGVWGWMDNSPWDYAHWQLSEGSKNGPHAYINSSDTYWRVATSSVVSNALPLCASVARRPQNLTFTLGTRKFVMLYTAENTGPAARASCIASGMELASIHSASENMELWQRLRKTQMLGWIGVRTLTEGHNFAWLDGSPIDYWRGNTGTGWLVMVGSASGPWWQKHGGTDNALPLCSTNATGIPAVANWSVAGREFALIRRFHFYESAKTACRQLYASDGVTQMDIASIHSKDELNAIKPRIPDASLVRTYLGGRRDLNLDEFYWEDGSVWDFVLWGTGQPDRTHETYLDTDGLDFHDVPSYMRNHMALCAEPPKPNEATLNGRTFHIGTRREKNFTKARDYCRSLGASYDLASIHSSAENALIYALLGGNSTNGWLGATTDEKTRAAFSWLDGSAWNYANWVSSQPADINGGKRNYLVFEKHLKAINYWVNHEEFMNASVARTAKLTNIVPVCATRVLNGSVPSYNTTTVNGRRFRAIYEHSSNWTEARGKCLAVGMDLASIHSWDEHNYARKILPPLTHGFIGTYRKGWSDGLHMWSDGSPMNFAYFATFSPGWGTIYHESGWKLQAQPVTATVPLCADIATNLPSGKNVTVDGRRFLIGYRLTTHVNSARQYCQDIGMDLASIHSKRELDALLEVNPHGLSFWTGGRYVDGNWTWIDESIWDFAPECFTREVTDPGKKNIRMGKSGSRYCWAGKENYMTLTLPLCATPPKRFHSNKTSSGREFRVVLTERANWTEARDYCQKQFGGGFDLASVHTEEEQILVGYLANKVNRSAWLGGEKESNCDFGWVDNSPFNFAAKFKTSNDPVCTELDKRNFLQILPGVVGDQRWIDEIEKVRGSVPLCATPSEAKPEFTSKNVTVLNGRIFRVDFVMKSNWTEARQHCLSLGMDLASLHSKAEHEAIRGLLPKHLNAWLGASDEAKEGRLVWSDGSRWDYVHFQTGYMFGFSAGAAKDWVLARHDSSPDSFLWYNVELPQPLALPLCATRPPPSAYSATRNATTSQGRVFTIVLYQTEKWDEARAVCRERGLGTLASIHSREEFDLARSIMPDRSTVWIGGNDIEQNGLYVWTDKSPFDYAKWGNREPTNDTQQTALRLKYQFLDTPNNFNNILPMCATPVAAIKTGEADILNGSTVHLGSRQPVLLGRMAASQLFYAELEVNVESKWNGTFSAPIFALMKGSEANSSVVASSLDYVGSRVIAEVLPNSTDIKVSVYVPSMSLTRECTFAKVPTGQWKKITINVYGQIETSTTNKLFSKIEGPGGECSSGGETFQAESASRYDEMYLYLNHPAFGNPDVYMRRVTYRSNHPQTAAPSVSPTTMPTTTTPSLSPVTLSPQTANPTASPNTMAPSTNMPTMEGPTAIHARFSNDARLVVVTYNRRTALLSPLVPEGNVLCLMLLSEITVAKLGEDSVCYFSTATILHVRLGRGFVLNPGDHLGLKAGTLIGETSAASTSSASNGAQVVVVMKPEVPPEVSVSIIAPSTVGICEQSVSLVAELGGYAGRNMSITWELLEDSSFGAFSNETIKALAEVDQALASATRFSQKTVSIPTYNLTSGITLRIRVNGSNFLLQTSSAVHAITKGSGNTPRFILPAPLTIHSVPISAPFQLDVQVIPPECGAAAKTGATRQSIQAITHWSASKGAGIGRNNSSLLPGIIADPSAAYLYIPAGVLAPESSYKFHLNAFTATESRAAVSGSVNLTFQVFTAPLPQLVCTIDGGNYREIPTSLSSSSFPSNITFDASGSYDPSFGPGGNSSHLRFSWSLVELTSSALLPLSSSSAVLSIPRDIFVLGRQYEARLNLSDSRYASRIRISTQRITIVAAGAPSVRIRRPFSDTPFERGPGLLNLDTDLRLSSEVSASDGDNDNSRSSRNYYNWTCRSADGNLVPLAPLLLANSSRRSSSNSTYLYIPFQRLVQVLSPSVLNGGSLTFMLTVTNTAHSPHISGRSSFTVTLNEPPARGRCSAFPTRGTAFRTQFRLTCGAFEDAEVPLSYQFSLLLRSGEGGNGEQSISLCSKRRNAELETVLPLSESVEQDSSNATRVRASVYDSLGAGTHQELSLQVSLEGTNVSSLLSDLSRDLAGRVREGDMQQFIIESVGAASLLRTAAVVTAGGSAEASLSIQDAAETRESFLSLLMQVSPKVLGTNADDGGSSLARLLPRATAAGLLDQLTDYPQGREAEISNKVKSQSLAILANLSAFSAESYLSPTSSVFSEPDVHDFVTASVSAMSNILSSNTAGSPQQGGAQGGDDADAAAAADSNKIISILTNLAVWVGASATVGGSDVVVNSPTSSNQRHRGQKIAIAAKAVGVSSMADYSEVSAPLTGARGKFPRIALPSVSSSSSRNFLLFSLASISNTSLYPFTGEALADDTKDIVVLQVRNADNAFSTVKLSGYVEQPFLIEIPSIRNVSMTMGGQEQPECVFWDTDQMKWNTSGMQFTGFSRDGDDVDSPSFGCSSSHLTSFSARLRFRVSVNTISASDATNKAAFDPRHNSVMLLVLLLYGLALLLLPFANAQDHRDIDWCGSGGDASKSGDNSTTVERFNRGNLSTKEAHAEIMETEFWRMENTVRLMRARGQRTWSRWVVATRWAMRKRHPWLAVTLRHPGDYLNSQKRLAVLLLLILNSAVVCALLAGTTQELWLVQGTVALGLVACVLTTPVPSVVAFLFTRPPPSRFRVTVEKGGWLAKNLPCLLLLLTICGSEISNDMQYNLQDEDAEDIDQDDDEVENDNEAANDSEDDDDDDDANNRDAAMNQQRDVGGSDQGLMARRVSSIVGISHLVDQRVAAAQSSSSPPFNSSDAVLLNAAGGVGAHGGWVAGESLGEKSRMRRGAEKKRNGRVDEPPQSRQNFRLQNTTRFDLLSSKNSRRIALGLKPVKSFYARQYHEHTRSESVLGFFVRTSTQVGGKVGESPDALMRKTTRTKGGARARGRVPNREWVVFDAIAMAVCLLACLGCTFLLVVLSYAYRDSNGIAFVSSILSFPQDFVIRMVVIMFIESILLAPLCCGPLDDELEEGERESYDSSSCSSSLGADSKSIVKMTLNCDEYWGTINSRGVVDFVTKSGAHLGICVGWQLTHVNGRRVENVREIRTAVRNALATAQCFELSFLRETATRAHSTNGNDTKQRKIRGGDQKHLRPQSPSLTSSSVIMPLTVGKGAKQTGKEEGVNGSKSVTEISTVDPNLIDMDYALTSFPGLNSLKQGTAISRVKNAGNGADTKSMNTAAEIPIATQHRHQVANFLGVTNSELSQFESDSGGDSSSEDEPGWDEN